MCFENKVTQQIFVIPLEGGKQLPVIHLTSVRHTGQLKTLLEVPTAQQADVPLPVECGA